jgi:hypothetical protein
MEVVAASLLFHRSRRSALTAHLFFELHRCLFIDVPNSDAGATPTAMQGSLDRHTMRPTLHTAGRSC